MYLEVSIVATSGHRVGRRRRTKRRGLGCPPSRVQGHTLPDGLNNPGSRSNGDWVTPQAGPPPIPPLWLDQYRSYDLRRCPPQIPWSFFTLGLKNQSPSIGGGSGGGSRCVAQRAIANPIQIWSRTRPFSGGEPLYGGNHHIQVRRVCGEGTQHLAFPVPVGSEG